MKVLHIDRQRGWGGQLNRTLNVVAGLKSRGIDVTLVSHTDSPMIEAARQRGVEPRVLPMYGSGIYPTAARLRAAAGWRHWDIVHCHGARDQLIGMLLKTTGGCRRLVRTRHSYLPLRSGRFSVSQYGPVDAVVTNSRHTAELAVADGLPEHKVWPIYSSVDLDRFQPGDPDAQIRLAWGVEPGSLVIGHVARLGEPKGTDVALEAVAQIVRTSEAPALHLVVVGEPAQAFQPQARELGIENRVTFTGFRDDVHRLMRCFDIYLLPTRHEAMGTAFAEAAASGIPAVGTTVGGVPEGTGKVVMGGPM
ncbi:MAG: glycosyltransferase family 4 protein, partial [Phycisphaeraceae bacterium]